MSEFLERVLARKRSEAAGLGVDAASRPRPAEVRRDFRAALARPGLSVIAEFKRRSPSAGLLAAPGTSAAQRAREYAAAGAAALSILTDGPDFGGSFDDLVAAREATELPALCKDFIIAPAQIDAAYAAGADAVLLIVRALDDSELRTLIDHAASLDLDVLVETHDRAEIARALAAGARLLGINNRDLVTLDVDLERCLRLRDAVPEGCVAVAESGIANRRDLDRVQASGFDAVLVGTSLMRGADGVLSTALPGASS